MPRKKGTPVQRVSFDLHKDLHKQINKAVAQHRAKSKSELVKLALCAYLSLDQEGYETSKKPA